MADIYKARWDFITKMFSKIKPYAEDTKYKLEIAGCEVENIVINDREITSRLLPYPDSGGNKGTALWAENDKELDHGLYRSIPEWKNWFEVNIKVYSVESIKWM